MGSLDAVHFIGTSADVTAHLRAASDSAALLDWQPVAEMRAPSGELLLVEPSRYQARWGRPDQASLRVPSDRPLTLWVRGFAAGGEVTRVAGLRVTHEGSLPVQGDLPVSGIDTARLMIADRGALDRNWKVGGPRNSTRLYVEQDVGAALPEPLLERLRVAGWPFRPDRFGGTFERPLEDEDLEAIAALLAEHAPGVALNPVACETWAALSADSLRRRLWLPLIDGSTAWGLITSTGWGDGSYPWRALDPSTLEAGQAGYEVDFITTYDLVGRPLLDALRRRTERKRAASRSPELGSSERVIDDIERMLELSARTTPEDPAFSPLGVGLRRYLEHRASNRAEAVVEALHTVGGTAVAEGLAAALAAFGPDGMPGVPAVRVAKLRAILSDDPDALVAPHHAIYFGETALRRCLADFALTHLVELVVPEAHRDGARVERACDVTFDDLAAHPVWIPTGVWEYLYAHPGPRPPGPTAGLLVAATFRLASGVERPGRLTLPAAHTGQPGWDTRHTEPTLLLEDGTPCPLWLGERRELPETLVEALLSMEGAVFPVAITVDPATCPGVEPLVLRGFFRLAGTGVLAVPF